MNTKLLPHLLARILIAVGILLLAIALLLSATGAQGGADPQLVGVTLPGDPAPDFSLTDQDGATVRLSELRGKAVTLSFLYTDCPDVCPLTAAKVGAAYRSLSAAEQARVVALAITVDPARDTQQRRALFVAAQGLGDVLRFLGGAKADLAAAWDGYHIGVQKINTPGSVLDSVNHTSVTYVIDPQGRARAYLSDQDFSSADLAADLRAVLAAPDDGA